MEQISLTLTIFEHRPQGLPARQLELCCRVSHSASIPLCILDAWLTVDATSGLRLAEGRLFYTMHNLVEPAVIPAGKQGLASIVIPLPSVTLQQIEQRRAGKDLVLRISSRVRICPLCTQGETQVLGAPFETHFVHGYNPYIEHTISQSDWIKTLRGLAWSELELLEIPLATITASPYLARAYKRFEEAQEFYRRGDWEEAMSNCRKVFEAVIKDTTGKDDLSESEAAFKTLITEPAKAKSINDVIKSFAPFLHLARHEQSPSISIKPEDAMLALQVTGSMLTYLANK